MNLVEIKSDEHIKIAKQLFSYVDSSISFMFMNNISSAISAYLINDNKNISAYFSYETDGTIYVYISCDNETEASSRLICDLFRNNIYRYSEPIIVWIRNENNNTINQLKSKFSFDESAYGMTEFIMKRADFRAYVSWHEFIVKGYEDKHIDIYLDLLDRAMTYHQNATYYSDRREEYRKKFNQRNDAGYFRAFWDQNKLIGLYLRGWKDGDEIELLAVDPNQQMKGYGTQILYHAINELFISTEKEGMYLYCVDHNKLGQSFYRKVGMGVNDHSYKMKLLSDATREICKYDKGISEFINFASQAIDPDAICTMAVGDHVCYKIYENNGIYSYVIMEKAFDDYDKMYYWTAYDNRTTSLFDTKDKAVEAAMNEIKLNILL